MTYKKLKNMYEEYLKYSQTAMQGMKTEAMQKQIMEEIPNILATLYNMETKMDLIAEILGEDDV